MAFAAIGCIIGLLSMTAINLTRDFLHNKKNKDQNDWQLMYLFLDMC